ncbi:hypothetical protein [Spirosoma sp.]|uniref:hypothetical protein n=1 Tax=Spirosoma sp. TaxID=1899569 RepID=UPI003B3B8A23
MDKQPQIGATGQTRRPGRRPHIQMGKRRLPTNVASTVGKDHRYNWVFFRTNELDHSRFQNEYGSTIRYVVREAFPGLNMTVDVGHLLERADIIGMVVVEKEVVGMCSLSVSDTLYRGEYLAWVNKIALMPVAQKKGLATIRLVTSLRDFLPGKRIGYLGCFSQNPELIEGFSRLGTRIYPIPSGCDTSEGDTILNFLAREVPQCIPRIVLPTNQVWTRGFVEGLYGRNITPSTKTTSTLISELEAIGFDADRGDAVILVIHLK